MSLAICLGNHRLTTGVNQAPAAQPGPKRCWPGANASAFSRSRRNQIGHTMATGSMTAVEDRHAPAIEVSASSASSGDTYPLSRMSV